MAGDALGDPSDERPAARPSGYAAWRTRGYLPHFDGPHVVQHVSFHLVDSIPLEAAVRLEAEVTALPPPVQGGGRARRIHEWIDAGHGCCILRDPTAASLVQDALRHFDGVRYRLLAWVVMPNHVHAVLEPMGGWTVARIVASWKTFTGRRLAPRMPEPHGVTGVGRVWHPEYWDRFVRDADHLDAVISYVERNPVRARLVGRAEEWPWSSAGVVRGDRAGGSGPRDRSGDFAGSAT